MSLRDRDGVRFGRIRHGIKWTVDLLASVLVSPLALIYWIHLQLPGTDRDTAIQGYCQLAALWPSILGVILRRAFLRMTLAHCSRATYVGFGTLFATPAVTLHSGVYIGSFCNLGHVTIGRDTLLGSNVTVLSGRNQHRFDRLDTPIRHQGGVNTPVHIGEDVWIGNAAIIMADVDAHAVVAAGAVVVKPVAAFAIVAGNPAKVVGDRQRSAAFNDSSAAGPSLIH